MRFVTDVLTLIDCPETKHENAQGRVALLVAILVGSYLLVITPHTQLDLAERENRSGGLKYVEVELVA